MPTRRGMAAAAALAAGVAVLLPLAGPAGAADQQAAGAIVTYTVTGLDSVAERTAVARSGVVVLSAERGTMTVRATQEQAAELRAAGHELITMADVRKQLRELSAAKKPGDFPEDDADYHNYDEMVADRKSTRLNSSHVKISYAVFCLKKKKIKKNLNIHKMRCVLVNNTIQLI